MAGPHPVTPDGNRNVIAAVDYAKMYGVVAAVPSHTGQGIAKFILVKNVLVYGPTIARGRNGQCIGAEQGGH